MGIRSNPATVRRPRERALTQPPRVNNDNFSIPKERQVRVVGSVDYTIFLVVSLLVLIGIVMVFSASYINAANNWRGITGYDPFYFLRLTAMFALVGFIAMNILANISYEIIRPFSLMIYLVVCGLLVGVMIFGLAAGGATRWMELPIIGRFQPSELAKPAIIFMMAFMVEKFQGALRNWGGFLVFCGIVGGISALVLYGGFSTALIVAVIGFGMIFVASPYFWRFVAFGGLGVGTIVVYLGWIAGMGDGAFRAARVDAWLDPFADQQGAGFQIVQSLYAIASGGWFGLGIGQSRQASFVPEPHNDIIFAIIVEELGFAGAGLILVLFGILIWRGIVVSLNAPDTFSSMVAIGIVFSIAFQAIINVAVVTNTIPNTGVPLPFISYGGTSLMVYMAMAGVLLNISRYTKQEQCG